ncbi:MAG TPA: TraB/GumN family protein [Alphaproteobacteria bacterium]|nr:TraB/GumN family protein [Alphaproteobacteria bacterium]
MPIARALRFAVFLLLLLPHAATAEALRHGHGLLWQVGYEAKRVAHIFGTMHSADPEILALPPPVLHAFRAAPSLSIEVILDETAMQRVNAAMRLPKGQRLQDFVPPDVFSRAAAAAEPLGWQPIHLSRLKPWAVAMLISMPPDDTRRKGGSGRLPLDLWLMHAARARGKPVYALETLSEQVNVFDAMSTEDQVAHLRAVAMPVAEKNRLLAAMKDAYLRGDIEQIFRMVRADERPQDRTLREKVDKRLLDDRNRRMVERMLPRFDEGGAFIAIGAAHLPGDNGVLALLERRGYSVTRLH